MKLSDIMGNAGLSFYAQVALVIFFGVFIAVTLYTWKPSRRAELNDAAMILNLFFHFTLLIVILKFL